MDQGSSVIRLAVFGSPISHSRSPEIHRSFARQCGLEVDYQAIEAKPENFPQRLEAFTARGGRGCNVTVPLKHEAWKLAQKHSDSSRRAQAANTLVFRQEKDWFADNTDGRGLIRDLVSNLDHPLAGTQICIIGAGGAVASILGDLLTEIPACIIIANRNPERAEQLCESFASLVGKSAHKYEPGNSNSSRTKLEAISLPALQMQAPFDLIINATSLGHDGKHPGLPLSLFHPDSLCYDLNYGKVADPLRKFCREATIRYQDGIGMLVEQAALSFELWTGKKPNTLPLLEQL